MVTMPEAPGTLSLANALVSGISAESVATADLSKALNSSQNVQEYAQDMIEQGQKMATITTVMEGLQYAFIGLGVAAGVGGVIASLVDAIPAALANLSKIAGQVVQVGTSVFQGTMGGVQGGLQAYKSTIQSDTQIDQTAVSSLSESTGSNGDTMKNLSQGASAIGAAISAMLSSAGTIETQRFV